MNCWLHWLRQSYDTFERWDRFRCGIVWKDCGPKIRMEKFVRSHNFCSNSSTKLFFVFDYQNFSFQKFSFQKFSLHFLVFGSLDSWCLETFDRYRCIFKKFNNQSFVREEDKLQKFQNCFNYLTIILYCVWPVQAWRCIFFNLSFFLCIHNSC
jgi:hypothetical protein